MLSHRCIVNECLGPWAVSVGRGSWSVAWVSSRGGVHINSDQNQSHGSSPTDPWDRLHCERSVHSLRRLPNYPSNNLSIDLQFQHVKVSSIAKLRGMVHGSKFAIFMTILMGAFVAGLDAGLVYNSWPKYGENWMPVELTKEAKFHPTDFFNDPACAQFMHRNLAYFTLVMVTLTWLKGRKMALGPRAKLALHSTMLMAIAQASLGIVTLLHYVPTSLASIHQNGALILASAIIWLANEIRRIPK